MSRVVNEDLPSTERLVAFLRSRDAYPERPSRVEVIETHMAWVFLTDRRAYKLKKPVRYAFLDFSTVDARYRDGEAEVTLNRRLARDVYLDVLPVTIESSGGLALGGAGAPVDWLVVMRRLPRSRMLDELIARDEVTDADIEALLGVLAAFFDRCASVPIDPAEYVARFRREVEEQIDELRRREFGLSPELVTAALEPVLDFCWRQDEVLAQRVEEDQIVDGHGDLRPEHVCLELPPVVIDCIEFNPAFRTVDPADEIAFLGMECERLGGAGVAARIIERFCRTEPTPIRPELLRFYRGYRAGLRAKLSAWHLLDHPAEQHEQWRKKAEEYLRLAACSS